MMAAKSQIFISEVENLRNRRKSLVESLVSAKKDHEEKERKSQAANRVSMNSYYQVKEIEQAIEKIDEAIASLDSVEKDRW